MKNIESFIEEYLSRKTEYAVQIVGKWGVGKTFFYRNRIEEIVRKTKTFHDNRKTYKPVYISLFGLKSTEDIATKIVLEFYQSKLFNGYFKGKKENRTLKLTQGVFKIALRGFLNFKRLGNLDDYLTDIQEIGKNVLDEEEILICFDDLERKDSDLTLQDLIGYINSLVDEGVKVLIITNEDTLKGVSQTDYKDLKEKVIDITVPFIIPTEVTVKSIIQNKYLATGHQVYAKFLEENLETIVQIAKAANNNYRHLVYALDVFHKCYSNINTAILATNHEIKEHVQDKIEYITRTSLALAIEYKSSRITHEDGNVLSEQTISIRDLINPSRDDSENEHTEEEKFNPSTFMKKYAISRGSFKLFDSIFQYVTNVQEFNIDQFIDEFTNKYRLIGGKTLSEYKVMERLSRGNCLLLSDDEYSEVTRQLISNAKNGKYLPSEYLSIMYYSERYGNPLDLDLDQLVEELKFGLKKAIKRMPDKSKEFTRFDMSGGLGMSTHNQSLYDYGKQEIAAEVARRKSVIADSHLELLTTNPRKFFEDYEEDHDFKYSVDQLGVFQKIPYKAFSKALLESDKFTLEVIQYVLADRYKETECSPEEVVIAEKLIKELKQSLPKVSGRIQNHLISEIIKKLELARSKQAT